MNRAGADGGEGADDVEGERMKKARSLEVQRNLASRLVAAQSRWLEPPPKIQEEKKKKVFDDDDDDAASASSSGAFAFDDGGGAEDTVVGEAYTRGQWLLGLLVLQSSSSVVLQSYETLVRDNIVITLFLTMLVGAG